jgi:hypothetical protein
MSRIAPFFVIVAEINGVSVVSWRLLSRMMMVSPHRHGGTKSCLHLDNAIHASGDNISISSG